MEVTSTGAGFLVLIWVLTTISLLIVGLRIIAKAKINQFRLDDVLMITALVCTISCFAVFLFYQQNLTAVAHFRS
jgi:hypothetical protein